MGKQNMKPRAFASIVICLTTLVCGTLALSEWGDPYANRHITPSNRNAQIVYREVPDDPWMPRPTAPPPGAIAHAGPWVRGPYVSVQVNVDEFGRNVVGDAANEPSIAIDPRNLSRIVIGWRQFDSVQSSFRQAGWAYSHDAGRTWTFSGVLEEGVFRSDPVLDADADGNFYFYSLTDDFTCDLFKSVDGGMSWLDGVPAFGGDKAWMAIDRTDGIGSGNIYCGWSHGVESFARSTDGGLTFETSEGWTWWGTITVGPDGEVYMSSGGTVVKKSVNAQNSEEMPVFSPSVFVDLGAGFPSYEGPNPGGLLGQPWIATDHSQGPARGNVYVLGSVRGAENDPLDVMFSRSTDGGATWSDPIRVNDDPPETNAWQWFGTMSVAPSGRIDAIWNDTRNTAQTNLSELYYAFSIDNGMTWSENVPLSPVFDSFVGWPNQDKIGDYYHMVSDDAGVNLAYAATFNGEQDVYFLRIGMRDCNANGTSDVDDIAMDGSEDCDGNSVPDECQRDFDGDGFVDGCDFDIDNDGVLNDTDVCAFTLPGTPVDVQGRPKSDTNGNCRVDLIDYWRLKNCLQQSGPAVPAPSNVCVATFDYDADANIDLADFAGFAATFSGVR